VKDFWKEIKGNKAEEKSCGKAKNEMKTIFCTEGNETAGGGGHSCGCGKDDCKVHTEKISEMKTIFIFIGSRILSVLRG
jgi:hypothetical protein